MDLTADEEFRKIRECLGRNIEVSIEEFLDPPVFGPRVYSGRLDEVRDYQYVRIFVGAFGTETVLRQIAFIGGGRGIALIRDEQGQVLYQNSGLAFKKPWPEYNIFFDAADNEDINRMRRAKFGEGQDYKRLG